MVHIKLSVVILITAYLSALSGCNIKNSSAKSQDDHLICYDVEALKKAFGNIEKTSVLYKYLGSTTKSLSQIKAEYGEPIEEYVDTFRYGRYVYDIHPDISTDSYYEVFPNTLWKIPLLIIHRCVWADGNKDVVLFFLNDCNKGEQPVCGYIKEYNDDYLPLRLLAEKDLSPCEVIKKRGFPVSESVYPVFYGVDYAPMEDIYSLRDIPEANIHTYTWKADSVRSLILIYMDDDNDGTIKPVWGFQCHNSRLMLE